MIRRVMRSLTIALSRGHDERVRFLDLMYKRHLLYGIITPSSSLSQSLCFPFTTHCLDSVLLCCLSTGACWRLADLERIYEKFSEEEIEELQELCFPSKTVFDPLLIASIQYILLNFRSPFALFLRPSFALPSPSLRPPLALPSPSPRPPLALPSLLVSFSFSPMLTFQYIYLTICRNC